MGMSAAHAGPSLMQELHAEPVRRLLQGTAQFDTTQSCLSCTVCRTASTLSLTLIHLLGEQQCFQSTCCYEEHPPWQRPGPRRGGECRRPRRAG